MDVARRRSPSPLHIPAVVFVKCVLLAASHELHDRVRHRRVVAEDSDPALADPFVLLPDDEGEDAVWVVLWEGGHMSASG